MARISEFLDSYNNTTTTTETWRGSCPAYCWNDETKADYVHSTRSTLVSAFYFCREPLRPIRWHAVVSWNFVQPSVDTNGLQRASCTNESATKTKATNDETKLFPNVTFYRTIDIGWIDLTMLQRLCVVNQHVTWLRNNSDYTIVIALPIVNCEVKIEYQLYSVNRTAFLGTPMKQYTMRPITFETITPVVKRKFKNIFFIKNHYRYVLIHYLAWSPGFLWFMRNLIWEYLLALGLSFLNWIDGGQMVHLVLYIQLLKQEIEWKSYTCLYSERAPFCIKPSFWPKNKYQSYNKKIPVFFYIDDLLRAIYLQRRSKTFLKNSTLIVPSRAHFFCTYCVLHNF